LTNSPDQDPGEGDGEIERISLRHGELTFSASAAGRGPLVLLLHGFPDHARTFRFQLGALAEAGYRAVAPMMRGYEPSSQPPDRSYTTTALASDVVAWLDQLGAEKAHLVGHDWGAAVAYSVASLTPQRLLSLTTIATPPPARLRKGLIKVPRQFLNSWYALFFQVPGISEAWVERNGWRLIHKLWQRWSPSYELPSTEWAALVRTMSAPGVKQAMLRYYRTNLVGQLTGRPITFTVPTLAIAGAEDGCGDPRLYDISLLSEDFSAGLSVHRIERAGHFVHLEQPGELNQLLLSWIDSHPS
jgi:pimeloyl-ACP methyl ester carboxylesterase